jgi:hypothetical protein
LRVVDANGIEVGIFAPPNSAIREIDGTWVQTELNGTAFAPCSTSSTGCPWYVFESSTCDGPSYIFAGDGLVRNAVLVGNTIRYAAGPVSTMTINSLRVDDAGTCYQMSGTQASAEMKSVPAPTAPFHLSR